MHLENGWVGSMSPDLGTSFYGMESDFIITEMSENMKAFTSPSSLENQEVQDLDLKEVSSSLGQTFVKNLSPDRQVNTFTDMIYENCPHGQSKASLNSIPCTEVMLSEASSIPISPPSINVESADDLQSSLLSSSSAITEALGDLNSDLNLPEDEWQSTLDSFLSGIPLSGPLPELVVSNQRDEELQKQVETSQSDSSMPSDRFLGLPGVTSMSDITTTDGNFAPEASVCYTMSPMSISPGGSSIPSPMTSLRSSFNSGRRYKRPHSTSPLSHNGFDFNSVIRSSPNCLISTSSGTASPQNISMPSHFSSAGSYGHYLPRPESNNNNSTRSNLNFTRANSEEVKTENCSISSPTHFNSAAVSQTHILKSPELENVSCSTNLINTFTCPSSLPNPYHSSSSSFPPTSSPPTHNVSSPSQISHPCSSVGSPNQIPSVNDSNTAVASKIPHVSLQSSTPTDTEDQDEDGENVPRVCRWVDCNAVFSDRASLSRHIERVHVDQRKGDDYTCFWAACQRRYRAFNARYKLLIHMRVHSGEKPNKCTFPGCDKAFSRLENLKIHLRSHTGERPYVCVHSHCNKAFSNSSDRAKHQRTHVDAKPYVCCVPGCNKRYTDPSSLRKHVKNHNPRDQLLAKRKVQSKDPLNSNRGPHMAPLPSISSPTRDEATEPLPCMGNAADYGPIGDIGGDVVRFSLRCHVLSRRPREIDESLSLPELTLATQEDLDLWIS